MSEMRDHKDISSAVNALSGAVVDSALHVHKDIGPGFGEDVYQEALIIELRSRGIDFVPQKIFAIFYKGQKLTKAFRPDIVVGDSVLVELKAVERVLPIHQAQMYSYLKASGLPLGLLINFNVNLIKDGIGRYANKFSESPNLRVLKT